MAASISLERTQDDDSLPVGDTTLLEQDVVYLNYNIQLDEPQILSPNQLRLEYTVETVETSDVVDLTVYNSSTNEELDVEIPRLPIHSPLIGRIAIVPELENISVEDVPELEVNLTLNVFDTEMESEEPVCTKTIRLTNDYQSLPEPEQNLG